MAGRDIEIPTGPDKTAGFTIPEVIPGVGSAPDQTVAHPPISTADLRGLDVEAQPAEGDPVAAWLSTPMDAAAQESPVADALAAEAAPHAEVAVAEDAGGAAAVAGEAVSSAAAAEARAAADGSFGQAEGADVAAGAGAEGEAASASASEKGSPVNDVAASLGALKDSIDQGRELKAREKDREELAEKIDADREELVDRDDILANYMALVAEQDGIIAQSTQQRDARKAELSQVVARTEETSEALSRMRDYNDVQLQPLETALGRAQASADQAKNDERSRKSELGAAESEVKRAGEGEDATTARARLEVAQAAHDEAVARSNAAKDALAEAQQAYDALKEQVDAAEAPLEHALEDLEKQTSDLKEEIARLGDVISAASKRRQYCDSVYQYPAETEKLRASVEADEAALDRLDDENDELRERLAQSKAKSTKAKVLIGGIVVFVIVLILLFWFLSTR